MPRMRLRGPARWAGRPGRLGWLGRMASRDWWRSLTVRLTLLATGVTAVVLAGVLAGVLAVFSGQLSASVDSGLNDRLANLRASVQENGREAIGFDRFAELYSPQGRILASSARIRGLGSLLPDPTDVPCPGPTFLDRSISVPSDPDPIELRVLAACLPDGRVMAVAESLRPQNEARDRLLRLLLATAPVLLGLVALTVGRAVHSALRRVDVLTRRAEQISAGSDTAQRLPVMPGSDEITRLARTLDEMLARLGVAFERERTFVDDAAHELRTPLAVLRGEIELALSDLSDTAAVEESLRAARDEAERLSRLAEDLLVLARHSAGPADQLLGVAELSDVLTRTGQRLERPGLTVVVDVPGPIRVRSDESRIERILTNLIVNAGAAGATTVRLEARGLEPAGRRLRPGAVNENGDEVLLLVEDDGPGFPPAFLPSAFERFSRADAARTRGRGAGLGLALVQALATGVGGSVSADNDSRLGGAAVRVILPRG
jgi:two-component system, OmpR family, sensor kinase